MPNYRRHKAPGGTFFFTVTLADRGSELLVNSIDLLRESVAQVRREHPFAIESMVIMPDHLHAIWTLPRNDSDFSTRWRKIKGRFSKAVGAPQPRSRSQAHKGEAGIWQRRFWEHCIRDQADFDTHLRFCLYDPVKHGFVDHPADWLFSSIHRDLREGRLEEAWVTNVADGQFGE